MLARISFPKSCPVLVVTSVFLLAMILGLMSCKTRRLESAGLSSISQTQVRLKDDKGQYWTRHVVAVLGFNHLSPRAAAGYSRLEFVRADKNPRDPDQAQAELLRRAAPSIENLHFLKNGRLDLFQNFPKGEAQGERPYLLSGSHDLYFVGCLVKQNNERDFSDRISVLRLPLSSGLSSADPNFERRVISLSEARYIWELIPSVNPSEFANQYGTRRYLGLGDKVLNMDYAGKESVLRMLSTPKGYEAFTQFSLGQANPAEKIMLESKIESASNDSQEYVCRILLGPVDTYENFVTFGLEELVRDEAMSADLESLDFRYGGGPEMLARGTGQWLKRHWLTVAAFGLTAVTYLGTGPTVAAVPVFFQGLSQTAGVTRSALLTAGPFISEGIEIRNAELERERIRRRELKRVVIPESVRPLALSEGLHTALQMAVIHIYAGRVALLLLEDSKRETPSRHWPAAPVQDASGQPLAESLVSTYVSNFDAIAAHYRGAELGRDPELFQENWEQVNAAVLAFSENYPATANAILNDVLAGVFNSLSIGSETSLETFAHLVGVTFDDKGDTKKLELSPEKRGALERAYKAENIFNTYRQLQARSRRGTFLSREQVLMMTGPNPLRPESPSVLPKIAAYRSLLMKLLSASELDTSEERSESRQLFASLANSDDQADDGDVKRKVLFWKDKLESVRLAESLVASASGPGAARASAESCDLDSRDCVSFQEDSSKAKTFTLALEALDGLSQLSTRAATCNPTLAEALCTELGDVLTNLPERYQGLQRQCRLLSSQSGGRAQCSRLATHGALEHLEAHCAVEGKPVSECLSWLQENLVITSGEGYWPAGGGFEYSASGMLREFARLEDLEGPMMSRPESDRLVRLRNYFTSR